MSMLLTAKAMSLKVGNPIRKLVLLKLADQANDKGECWPSHKSIAEGAECSERAVITHIDWLAENGFLWVEKRHAANGRTMTNIYHLTLGMGGESPAPRGESPAPYEGESPAPGGESPAPYEGESPAPKPVNNQSMNQSMNQYGNAHAGASAPAEPVLPDRPNVLADGWDGNDPEPPAKPQKRQPSAAQLELAAYHLLADKGVDGQLAADYMALRKSKRAGPLTQTALAGLEREANLAGLSLTQAVTVCCERSWVGFKADWFLRDGEPRPGPAAPKPRQNTINRVPQHTNGGVHLAKDIL